MHDIDDMRTLVTEAGISSFGRKLDIGVWPKQAYDILCSAKAWFTLHVNGTQFVRKLRSSNDFQRMDY